MMKIIKVRHSGHCMNCNGWIMTGEFALWEEGVGIKHEECPVGSKEPPTDDTRLIVHEPDEDFYLKK